MTMAIRMRVTEEEEEEEDDDDDDDDEVIDIWPNLSDTLHRPRDNLFIVDNASSGWPLPCSPSFMVFFVSFNHRSRMRL